MKLRANSRGPGYLRFALKKVLPAAVIVFGFLFLALASSNAQKAKLDAIKQDAFDIFQSEPQKPERKTSTSTPSPRRARAERDIQQVGEQVVWEEVRNLFMPQRSSIEFRRQQEAAANVDSSTRFPVISGIVTDSNGDNMAVLDGENKRVGERLKDFVVQKITRDRVTLEGDETYILELKPHQNPAVKIFLVPAGSGEDEIILTTTTANAPAAPGPSGTSSTSGSSGGANTAGSSASSAPSKAGKSDALPGSSPR